MENINLQLNYIKRSGLTKIKMYLISILEDFLLPKKKLMILREEDTSISFNIGNEGFIEWLKANKNRLCLSSNGNIFWFSSDFNFIGNYWNHFNLSFITGGIPKNCFKVYPRIGQQSVLIIETNSIVDSESACFDNIKRLLYLYKEELNLKGIKTENIHFEFELSI